MAQKKTKKITKDQAIQEIDKLKKDLFNFRFQKINGQIKNYAKISQTKKSIAKLKTILKGIMPKKILSGIVVGDKPNKTITVLVEENINILYLKKLLNRKRNIACMMKIINLKHGDKVKIIETKPFSKTKKFQVLGDNK